ncbi:acyltransferase [Chitinibacter bivalviorum]|uniref:Acyltransferase n=1 Tax=Chitinibacter bivalviorum TaxID=2739434 RepID=A0A7H9BLJ0_9NEIS|nr:acyltransferase [Chitinibacter bivalviorum]QLG89236.1 acyltransferase [Chitinibacter bivalviorum]
MSPVASQRFLVLDSFRGLCAVSVVLFHLHLAQSIAQWPFFRSAGVLVEFFFVLSGFVMAHRYLHRPMDGAALRQFMISRCCRILPLHWATLLLMCGLILLQPWLLHHAPLTALPEQVLDRDFAQQWLYHALLLQGWLPAAEMFDFNGPAWSISVEFYLYIAFAIVLLLAQRHSSRVFVALVALCSLATLLFAPQIAHSPGLRGLTCFFMGAATYSGYLRLRHLQLKQHWMSALEILTLLGLYAMITLNYPLKSYWATWGFAAAILVFAQERGLVSRALKHPSLIQLGEWSFSIYLVHYFILHLLNILLSKFHPQWLEQIGELQFINTGNALANNVLLLTIMATVLLCARASYQWIERPGMRLGKYWQNQTPQPALVLAGVKI